MGDVLRKFGLITLTIALSTAATSPAHAEADANTFLSKIDQGNRMFTKIIGAYAYGSAISNAILTSEGKSPLYCQPAKLGLTSEQTVDLVRRFVEAHPTSRTSPAAVVTLFALRDTFPCK